MTDLRRHASALVLAVLLALFLSPAAGCGSTDTPHKEAGMTPDQANAELTRLAREVMAVLAPGERVDLNEDGPATPCGGLGGNERSKLKYGLIAKGTQPPAGDSLTRAAAVLRKRGYTVNDPQTMGDTTTVTFTGKAVSGDLTKRGSDPITFGAETECLDNPDA